MADVHLIVVLHQLPCWLVDFLTLIRSGLRQMASPGLIRAVHWHQDTIDYSTNVLAALEQFSFDQ